MTLRSLVDARVWAVAIIGGLALSLWVAHAERGAAEAREAAVTAELKAVRRDLERAGTERDAARDDVAAVEAELKAYADQTTAAWRDQAAASARMAADLADINRRVRAASLEISRADSGLRLDDPLPVGLRHGLACAGGSERACRAASAADPGGVPGGTADPGPAPGRATGGDDGA